MAEKHLKKKIKKPKKHISAIENTRSTPPWLKTVGKLHCRSLTRVDLRRKKTLIQNKQNKKHNHKKSNWNGGDDGY